MALSGDPLAILLFLAGAMFTFALGAIAMSGVRERILWCVAAVFGLLTVGWLFSPDPAPMWGALLRSGAPVMLVTITAVAVMVSGRTSVLSPKTRNIGQPGGRANMPLKEAIKHISESGWGRKAAASPDGIAREISDKLFTRQLSAFGRTTAKGALQRLSWETWERVVLDPHTGNAGLENHAPSYFDIQLDRDFVQQIWPRAGDWKTR